MSDNAWLITCTGLYKVLPVAFAQDPCECNNSFPKYMKPAWETFNNRYSVPGGPPHMY